MRTAAAALAAFALTVIPVVAHAAGNLESKPTTLEPLTFDGKLNFSTKEYNLETGKYYKWQVISKGGEEFSIFFPDLFRLAAVYQMRVNTVAAGGDAQFVEVHTVGPIHHLEFDSPGEVDLFFLPVAPGDVSYYIKGFEAKGMAGVMHIK